ncbi:MAG: hypothetical protein DHS20C19_09810 [Acidimicrobiales bacterium]|nr:MAG: hypothetical protein DHS20C19_09810 [Acidimicrobiales bacterium]
MRVEAPAASPPAARKVRAFGSYQHGLDGLRGYTIFCVLFYHARLGPYDGFYLSLSLFFVLSGYLITAILLDDRERAGRVDFKRFWARRVRRLAPAALGGVLLAVIFGATVATRSQAEQLPGDLLGVVFYVVNWTFIATDQSYTDIFAAPSPVQHYWSLAVEEQFYLVIPLSLGFLLRAKVPYRAMVGVLVAATLGSTWWMLHLFDGGANVDRLYFGTDTRIAEVLVGVLLAVVMDHRLGVIPERVRQWLPRVGWIFIAALAYLWTTYGVTESFSYRGGFLLNSVLTAGLIMAIVAQRGVLDRVFNWAPAVWVGGLSYGIYIYHFVLFLWLTPERTGLDPWPNCAVRFAATFVVAWASHRFVETPIRRGATFRLPSVGQAMIYPVVGLALVVGAQLTANTDGDDPLATLRDDGRSLLAPVATSDGVLDILVVHSADNSDVVDELESLVDDDTQIRVAAREVFSCDGGVVEVDDVMVCANWAQTWPDLVSEHDPDTVVWFVDGWAGDDLATLEVSGAETPRAVAASLLAGGFDLLSEQGAAIAAISSGQPFEVTFVRELTPYGTALVDRGTDPDVNLVPSGAMPDPTDISREVYLASSAETLLDIAALYQRADRGDSARVLIVGDSQARSLGYGLERWGAEQGVWVWNVATNGCGIADEGFKYPTGDEVAIRPECLAAVAAYESQVASFDPDLVVVLSSAWDLGPRRLPEWDEPKQAGDALFDAYLLREYEDALAILGSGGANVVWMQAPCLDTEPSVDQTAVNSDLIDADELGVLNADILPELVAGHDGQVALYDLDAVLCPGGVPLREADGVSPIRGDGVHFNVEGSQWFAETHGSDVLGLGGVRV